MHTAAGAGPPSGEPSPASGAWAAEAGLDYTAVGNASLLVAATVVDAIRDLDLACNGHRLVVVGDPKIRRPL